jgi:hypothetical protein
MAHFKINATCPRCNAINTSIYKSLAKPKEEGLYNLSLTMPCWHIDEKNCQLIGVNTQIPQWLEGKISLQGTNLKKVFPLLPSSEPPSKQCNV